jgi:hypothetical protein
VWGVRGRKHVDFTKVAEALIFPILKEHGIKITKYKTKRFVGLLLGILGFYLFYNCNSYITFPYFKILRDNKNRNNLFTVRMNEGYDIPDALNKLIAEGIDKGEYEEMFLEYFQKLTDEN